MPWRKGNRLHLVSESEAGGQTAHVFSEAKAALGIGYVPLAWQAFAAYPKFLDVLWSTLRPVLGTREFFELASKLRAEAYTFIHNYFKVPALEEGHPRARASALAEQLGTIEAAMLLLMTVQMQAFEGPVGVDCEYQPADRTVQSLTPEFIVVEDAPPSVRRALDDMRMAADLPYYSDNLRAFAQSPDMLLAVWHTLKPAMHSVFYEQAVLSMRESAWNSSQQIPRQVEMEYSRLIEAGVTGDEIAVVTRLPDVLVRGSAIGVLNAAFIKIGLEGGNQADAGISAEERVA